MAITETQTAMKRVDFLHNILFDVLTSTLKNRVGGKQIDILPALKAEVLRHIPFAFQVTAALAAHPHPLSCTTCTLLGFD
ncbi:hypothetical protein REG_1495 [Candidatus Regiella insecticola LSR1]|uniref:Uncharacterized protein n=1 Tax=Candidatus Regiella insecticola LSR1 TaxID=663321 RepID=E0WTW5_9ENTR|nr:hypothetical protein REG_1495 [Candidatus Regiella insecticola LSR1]